MFDTCNFIGFNFVEHETSAVENQNQSTNRNTEQQVQESGMFFTLRF